MRKPHPLAVAFVGTLVLVYALPRIEGAPYITIMWAWVLFIIWYSEKRTP